MDSILLTGLQFFSHVGVFPEEKEQGQPFILDLVCSFLEPVGAVESDRLDESVSYAEIYETVKAVVEPARFDLIEHLAGRVAEAVLSRFPIDRIEVTVKKPEAPVAGEFDYMGVRIERSQADLRMQSGLKEDKQAETGLRSYRAALSLGSNLGDREAQLKAGLSDLEKHPAITLKAVSSLYETAPWGVLDQPDFLNAAALIETTLNPFALLDVLLSIEKRQGRTREIHWGARTLDLDILWIDHVTISSPGLTVPHPHLPERPFILIPLAEISGEETPPDESVRHYKSGWYCPSGAETVV